MTLRGPDKLPASQNHYEIVIGDDYYYVVGGIQHGHHGASFQPSWIFEASRCGRRRRDIEEQMHKDLNLYESIQSQVETQLDNE